MSSPSPPPPFLSYITLSEAKGQLSIDDGLTIHDAKVTRLISSAIDWAENFCGRSLGQLLELNSPADSPTTPLPEPLDSPHYTSPPMPDGVLAVEGWSAGWTLQDWQDYYKNNPINTNYAAPLRRDIKEAILLKIEQLFDRNTDNWELLETTAQQMLLPYRVGMGV
jgi:hypothetical protein